MANGQEADERPKAKQATPTTAVAPVLNPLTPSSDQINQWISELSHDTFGVRQAAATRLLAAGISAREPLLAIADGPDPETRAAAKRLVALIDQSEFHRRLEAFAADTTGDRGLTLPGWEEYRELVGRDDAARALFVEMQKHEGPLLSAVYGVSAQPPEQLWEDRLLRIVQWQTTIADRSVSPPLGSCAAVLFLGSSKRIEISDRGAMLVENLIQRPPLQQTLATAGPQDALRRLVVGWILHCPNKNDVVLTRRLNLISMANLKEALPLAIDVAEGDPEYLRVPPLTKTAAMLVIGQLGRREHIKHLEPMLEDSTICLPLQPQVPGQPAANVQVRDVALVVMLQLTGQRPADYGYLHARLQPQRTFQIQTLHRENDTQRAEAIAKWRTWRSGKRGLGPSPGTEKSREPPDNASD